MRKIFLSILAITTLLIHASAASYTVQKGDTLWKIAQKYQIGLSEIKRENTDIQNYDLIYPGQLIRIPEQNSKVMEYEQEVIRLVNEIRAENGLQPLTYDWQLGRVARYKSLDMKENRYFSHTSPIYGSPFQMIRDFGISFKSAGENIARGYPTPQSVVNGWMNSSGHRSNILSSNYTKIGVGYVADGNYWTQMFIS